MSTKTHTSAVAIILALAWRFSNKRGMLHSMHCYSFVTFSELMITFIGFASMRFY